MIKSKRGTCRVGLFGTAVEIEYNNDEARELIHFLFRDLSPDGAPVSNRRFDVIMVGKPARISLWQEEKQLYFGESKHALASILVNEILYECIVNNSADQALHAAALACGDKGILLPGKSGSGKSSLAAWLTVWGCTYLTDELVLLSPEGLIRSFTRPFTLRQPTLAALTPTVHIDQAECFVGEAGTMVPHRCLNPRWAASTPRLCCLVFPKFIEHHPATLTKLTNAQGCMQLMGCYVNARNFAGHGFSELAGFVREVPSYELKFGSFSDVMQVLLPLLEQEQHDQ